MGILAEGEMERDRRLRFADGDRHAVIVQKQADLLLKIGAKEVGPGDSGGIGAGNASEPSTWQTIADLTGIDTCDEGVEIIVHVNEQFGNFNVKPAVRIKAVGGATGAYSSENLNESFTSKKDQLLFERLVKKWTK